MKDVGRTFGGWCAAQESMRRLTARLAFLGIPYAIGGGMAGIAHGHRQTTGDVDVVLTADSLSAFREQTVDCYEATRLRRGRRFLDRANGVAVDMMVAGHHPGLGHNEVRYPDPAEVAEVINGLCYLPLRWLIQL